MDSITESRVTRISKLEARMSLGDIFQKGLSSSILIIAISSNIKMSKCSIRYKSKVYLCTAVTGHSSRALSSAPSSWVPT